MMRSAERLLLAALLLLLGAAVALYVLAPAWRLAWLGALTLGANAAGLLLARGARAHARGAR